MPQQTGYAIADIAALKALLSGDLTDGYLRYVKSKDAWYRWNSTLTTLGNDDTVVTPNDNPTAGRWIKSGGTATTTNTPLIEYAKLSDTKPTGTAGGSYTANTEVVRTLNTVDNSQPWLSLATSQFTLQPGKYFINANVPGYLVGRFRGWLENSDKSIVILGTSEYAAGPDGDHPVVESFISGKIEINVSTIFAIKFKAGSANTGLFSLGVTANITGQNEVYTVVEIQKINIVVTGSESATRTKTTTEKLFLLNNL